MYVWIAFFLCVLAAAVKIGELLIVRGLESRWETLRQERAQDMMRSVQGAFLEFQREALTEAGRIAQSQELSQILMHGGDPGALFPMLEGVALEPEMSVEVYDARGELLAWWGRTAGLEHRQMDAQRETSFVSRGPVYSYLTITVPIVLGSEFFGTTVIHRLFDVNYPLSNRFMSVESFTRTFPRRIDLPLTYDFSHQPNAQERGEAVVVPLQIPSGDTIGYAFAEPPKLSAAVEHVRNTTGAFIALLLTGLSVILFFAAARSIHGSPGLVLRIISMSLLMWVVRYIWLWIGFPSQFFSSGIFGPRAFASPFGFGITRSAGELLITSALLLTNVSYLAWLVVPRWFGRKAGNEAPVNRGGSRFTTVLIVSILAAVFFVVHRGFTAAVRSAVFDSTLYYNDPTSVVPHFDAGIMLVSLLFLVLAFFMASLLIVVVGWHISRRSFVGTFGSWVVTFIIFLTAGVLFGILHPTPLTGPLARFLVFAGVFVSAVATSRQMAAHPASEGENRWRYWSVFGLALALALIILVYQLDDQIHQKERRSIELLAADLTRPVDAWLTYLLERAIGEMKGEESAHVLVAGDPEEVRNLAFAQWAKSILSREGFNCSVSFYDQQNHLVSNFRVGVASLVSVPVLPAQAAGNTQVTVADQRDGSGKRKYYARSDVVTGADGISAGHVEVVISARDPFLLRGEIPPVLRSYEREESERHLRSLVISEFVDGRLAYTTGEELPQDILPPRSALDGLRTERSAWADEHIGASDYETFYLRTDGGKNSILALARKKADWRWHVFDYLRYALFYAVVCGSVVLLALLTLVVRGYRFRPSFRARLVVAFVVVSLIPLFLLAYYNRSITIESAHQSILERLTNQTAVVRNHLLTRFRGDFISDSLFLQNVSDDWCERIAYEFGADFSVYVNAAEKGSSRPELFRVGILERRLSGNAFVRLARDGQAFFAETVTIGNYDYLVGYRSLIFTPGKTAAILAVPMLYTQVEVTEDLARRNALLFGAYAIVMLVGVLTGTIFARQIASPVRQLIAATRRIAGGDLDFRIRRSRTDEIGELHEAFNRMTQELSAKRDALLKAERELAWKEMAKQVAHEIKNPLTPIKLSIQHLRQAFRDRDKNFARLLEQVTKSIIDQIDSLSRIASQFADFARMPERQEEHVDVREVLAEAARLFEEHRDISVELVRPSEPMIVRADREELRRMFMNVIRNAIQAMNERGTVRLAIRPVDQTYVITISDTGPGIPDDIRPRLFEPNFSTKSEGMGLGLAIVKKTVDDLGGAIEIQSQTGKGTTVSISLPARPVRPGRSGGPARTPSRRRRDSGEPGRSQ